MQRLANALHVKGSHNPYWNKTTDEIVLIMHNEIADLKEDIADNIKSYIPHYKQVERNRKDLYDGYLILRDTESRMYKIYGPYGEQIDTLTDSFYMSEMLARSAIDLHNKRQAISDEIDNAYPLAQ